MYGCACSGQKWFGRKSSKQIGRGRPGMTTPAKKRRIVIPAVLILTFGAGTGLHAYTAIGCATAANSIAVLLSDFTGLPYAQQVSLALSGPSEMRQVIAEDIALTIPGLSADPVTRRIAYSAVQSGAVRYSLQRRKLFICPSALNNGRVVTGINPSQLEHVLRLLMMNELARALLDQNFDFSGRFKGNRNPGNASVLRALMEGFCAYCMDWLSANSASEDGIRRLAQSWAGGRLPRPDPSVYPSFDDPDPLRALGRHFISYLNRHEGTWALQKACTDPPRSVTDLFDPEAFLNRAETTDPNRRLMKGLLLDVADALGAFGNEMAHEQPSRILRKFAIAPCLLDPPSVGMGLRKTDEESGTDIILLLIRSTAISEMPLDLLIRGSMRPIKDITRIPGMRLELGNQTLVVSKTGQMAIQTGRLFDSGNAAGMVYAVAGQWGPWVLLLSARGDLRSYDAVMSFLHLVPSRFSSFQAEG